MVRSYAGCAKIISQHIYKASDFSHQINVNAAIEQQNQNSTCSIISATITEDTNALAFLLDNLLAANQTFGDKDCPSLCRLLIVALASCNHCLDSQNALVHEVKQALSRAINLPESNDKHIKIQAFASIINTMIETCPPIQNQAQQQNGIRNQPPNTNLVNNMMKIMHKKGLINDLARVPLYMDLSCAKCIETLNTILKPLETMTKTLNISVRKRSDLIYAHKSHSTAGGLIPLTTGTTSTTNNGTSRPMIHPTVTSANTTTSVVSLGATTPSSNTIDALNAPGVNASRQTSQSTTSTASTSNAGQTSSGARSSGSQRRSNNFNEEQSLRDNQQHSGVTSDVAGLNIASDNNLVLGDATGI